MHLLETSQEWLQQSSLLLKARPTTTRITTKYTVLRPNASKIEKRKRNPSTQTTTTSDSAAAAPAADPSALIPTLTLKTFDPESGVCLKYRTNRQAEVGRLIASLGMLGRNMAALPEIAEDPAALADLMAEQVTGTSTPVPENADVKVGAAGGGAGGKKKKKGKK